MTGRISITERIYEAVKSRILSGEAPPGARVDANEIAAREGVSPTPVRNALNRLVGAGYLISHSNEGFHVPFFAEQDLRELYDCCAAMLGLGLAFAARPGRRPLLFSAAEITAEGGVAERTEMFFAAIMALCGNRRLCWLFADVNARLRPARLLEERCITGLDRELNRLVATRESRDFDALKRAINAYHRRRIRYVSRIVALLRRLDASEPHSKAAGG